MENISVLSKQVSSNDYRYERKFFISEVPKQGVETLVKLHPAMFSEIYHQRFVNNIYFDSVNLVTTMIILKDLRIESQF